MARNGRAKVLKPLAAAVPLVVRTVMVKTPAVADYQVSVRLVDGLERDARTGKIRRFQPLR